MLSVAQGDSAHLMLASWRIEKDDVKVFNTVVTHETGVVELRALGKEQPEHRLFWSCKIDEQLPACDVRVTVLSDGGRGKLEGFFTLEPKHFSGPLQVTAYLPSDKNGKRVRL
jgi:hypothetical protein